MKRPRAEEKESTAKTTATTAADGGGGGGRPSPRLYVGGLHKSVKEGEILRLFVPHGRVVKEEYPFHMHGPRKGEPRGYVGGVVVRGVCIVQTDRRPTHVDYYSL